MAYKSLLTVLTDPKLANAPLQQMIALAEAQDAHAEALCLGVDRTQTGYYYAGANAMVLQETLSRANAEAAEVLSQLEGNLTGSIYSAESGADDEAYNLLAPALRQKVGRLLNDKMPTGVAVSPAMNHGGPYPATGHPGFTAVGIPASLIRFGMLQSYDNVRPERLPDILRDDYDGPAQRLVDGVWT